MSATSFTAFVLELAQDPDKVQKLRERPFEVLCDSDLTEEEKQIITSGDPVKIRNAMDPALGVGSVLVVVAVAVVVVTIA